MVGLVSITVKIPPELKERMKRLKINWSEYIRETILNRVEQEDVEEASAVLDDVRRKARPTPTSQILEWIREDRGR